MANGRRVWLTRERLSYLPSIRYYAWFYFTVLTLWPYTGSRGVWLEKRGNACHTDNGKVGLKRSDWQEICCDESTGNANGTILHGP